MSDNFSVGGSVKLRATFSVDDVLTDPTTITLSVRSPSLVTNAYTFGGGQLTQEGTGIFYRNVALDESGKWEWRWVGTGTVVAAAEGDVYAEESVFV